MRARSIVGAVAAVSFWGVVLLSVQARAQQQTRSAENAPGSTGQSDADFYAATNEVLQEMSKILDLPAKAPLRETIRTKDEIRQYLVDEQNKEESPEKRYVDRRTLEAFGLIPKGFPLDSFLLDLLTDQVAGLYDPQTKEFFIASWIAPGDQKEVMAHELTHALDDQYFHLKKWQNAVRLNDDASLARDAVIEGSALAAMMDYTLTDMHTSVRELSDIAPFIESSVADQMDKDPNLAKAPAFVRDELLFPYLEGAKFTQRVLKATGSWADFQEVFKNPPASTQQILHPDLYFQKVVPERVSLPHLESAMPRGYVQLDENVVGEFALGEVLKQFLGPGDAELYAPMWRGDQYALFENKETKQTILVVLLALDSESNTRSFFTAYRKTFEKKDSVKTPVAQGREFVAFDDVFLACVRTKCLSVEGADRSVFDRIDRRLGWPAEPRTNQSAPTGAAVASARR
ncbi:MAG TPA: hypothetical protein VKB26_05640 [Candidatus Acidoferrales bacterium]|nr:hypothetical protein [Candidatus Acidoferrales bacterium]